MKATINVGLVGYGFASKTFHVPLIQATEGLNLVAVSSSDVAKVRADLPEVEVESEARALCQRYDIDLIVIPTPNDTHFPLAKMALSAGKHVVVDKPFTVTLSEAKQLKSLAVVKERLISVFHNRRWDSDFLTVKALLDAGTLGRVTGFESRFDRFKPEVRDRWREKAAAGGGLWFDLGPHLLDQACELFGTPNAILLELGTRRDGAQADDDFLALLAYDDRRVQLSASALVAEATPRFRIHGTQGSYVKYGLDPQEDRLKAGEVPAVNWGEDTPGTLTLQDGQGEEASLTSREHPTQPGNYLAYYQGIVEAIQGHAALPVDIDAALRSMTLLEAGQDSHRQRRWIALKPNF
ncbi:oxidoreductase [Vreelandella populi]|uniref:oxidoreductase n=1 Tax=Vreelandella populi TaxID=2498858 RepID=UPI000F8C4213|nr:oxidoreductase [Halomonas populi]RUR58039.1 oxidoreductase [Halomonas populi]